MHFIGEMQHKCHIGECTSIAIYLVLYLQKTERKIEGWKLVFKKIMGGVAGQKRTMRTMTSTVMTTNNCNNVKERGERKKR